MIKVVAVGDISLGDHYFNMGHGTASFIKRNGLAPIFANVQEEFANADIVFGNLETPLRSGCNDAQLSFEEMAFCGRIDMAEQLATVGFNVVNIANNHILQHGVATFHETVAALRAANIDILGLAGEDGYCCQPVKRRIGEKTVALLGYSDIAEVYNPSCRLYARFTRDEVLSDINRVREWADLVFVSLHFGVEGISLPSIEARQTAHWLIDSGADVILGHHPHTFQPVELYREGVIAYSLGDFVFDLFWNKSYLDSAIMSLEFQGHAKCELKLIPTTFSPDFSVCKLTGKRREAFMATLLKIERLLVSCPDIEYRKLIGNAEKKMQLYDAFQKLIYFLKVLVKGNTAKKVKFFGNKISARAGF